MRLRAGKELLRNSRLNTLSPGYDGINQLVRDGVDDFEPVTPNSLLMGRRNAALPQVMYNETELLTRKNEETASQTKQIRKERGSHK